MLFLVQLFYISLFLIGRTPAQATAWIGYTLDLISAEAAQALGQISLTALENGTVAGELLSWTPPRLIVSQDVRIGLLADHPTFSDFTSNTFSTSSESLTSNAAVLNIHTTKDGTGIWAIGITVNHADTKQSDHGTSAGPPKLTFVSESYPPTPHVNKPVVLSREGKVQEPPPEKTLLQRYWWVLLAITFILMSGGGGDGK